VSTLVVSWAAVVDVVVDIELVVVAVVEVVDAVVFI
jgi:hypothetical protein